MQKEFSNKTREAFIQDFSNEEYDVAIIGGGITGAGVARDAASRGMKVALVEARDFAEGTSSRSSKLIHGGLRYLENLEFHLVFEALSERALLFKLAPHLVHPLRFVLPLFTDSRVGRFKMSLGMWLYDLLALLEVPQMHENLNAEQTKERVPILTNEKLIGSFVYSDAYMDDDQLVIETLRSANEFGAKSVNFVKMKGGNFNEGNASNKLKSIKCTDELTGKEFDIKAKHFVSSTGPWTDETGQLILPDWKKIMRPTKGVHITVSKKDLPLESAVVMTEQNRIIFVIPRHEMVIIGTTDTFYDGPLNDIYTTKEDIEYLLGVIKTNFPYSNINESKIIASYAGIRPLVDDGSEDEGKTSREHVIFSKNENITFISGGKYTTYRKMAEDVMNEVLENFSTEEMVKYSKNQTKQPLNSQVTQDDLEDLGRQKDRLAIKYGCSEKMIEIFVTRYGREALDILNQKQKYKGESELLQTIYLDLDFAMDKMMCIHLVDYYLRRSKLFLSFADHGARHIEVISRHMAQKLNWSEAQRIEQINALQNHQSKELSWKSQSEPVQDRVDDSELCL